MEKSLYYKIEPSNGEPYIIDPLIQNIADYIEAEHSEIKNIGEEEGVWLTVTFIWLTDKQFADLPEAY